MNSSMLRATISTVLVAVMVLTAGCGDEATPDPKTGIKPGPKKTEPAGTEPARGKLGRQAETAGDLKGFMAGALEVVEDEAKIKALCASLVIPESDSFFAETFGAEKGKAVAAEYSASAPMMGEQLPALFRRIARKGQTEISVRKLTDAADKGATGLQAAALKAMEKKTALYSVRFVKPGDKLGMHLWSFVYSGGRFRLAGKMRVLMK